MTSTTKKSASQLKKDVVTRHIVFADGTRQLSDLDRRTVERVLLDEKYGFVENEMFPKSNAQRKIFDQAPAIERPNTSWYHPVMEIGAWVC